MRVAEIMSTHVETCRPEETLEAVASRLWSRDCGMLPVVGDDGRVDAAITDRNVCMGAYTRGNRLADLRVADSMSPDVVCCGPDDEIEAAAKTMAAHGIRRLPVVDGEQRLCGVLSLNDLALAARDHGELGPVVLTVLSSVSEHRSATKDRSAAKERRDDGDASARSAASAPERPPRVEGRPPRTARGTSSKGAPASEPRAFEQREGT